MAQETERREFLARALLLAGGAAVTSELSACRAKSWEELTDLSAVASVTAMRKGDIKAEDYARALLDRAQRLESLNAFRTLDRKTVL